MTKNRSVSNGQAGTDHRLPPAGRPVIGCRFATCWSPVRAWQRSRALDFRGVERAIGLVGDGHRRQGRARIHRSGEGWSTRNVRLSGDRATEGPRRWPAGTTSSTTDSYPCGDRSFSLANELFAIPEQRRAQGIGRKATGRSGERQARQGRLPTPSRRTQLARLRASADHDRVPHLARGDERQPSPRISAVRSPSASTQAIAASSRSAAAFRPRTNSAAPCRTRRSSRSGWRVPCRRCRAPTRGPVRRAPCACRVLGSWSPSEAEGSMPSEPVSIAATSDSMSPNRLSVTMTSNCLGQRTSCMPSASAS